jgi:hypothetical protein
MLQGDGYIMELGSSSNLHVLGAKKVDRLNARNQCCVIKVKLFLGHTSLTCVGSKGIMNCDGNQLIEMRY